MSHRNQQRKVKLSILIDSTESMYRVLNQWKIAIQKTIPKLNTFLGKINHDSKLFEIQVIGFRNYNAPSDAILEYCPFTSNENELTQFIQSLAPNSGWPGWGNSAIEVAFKQINQQKKKPNIVILVANAAANSKADIKRKRRHHGEQYWQNAQDGLFTNLDWKQELNKFMHQNGDTQVFCFYSTKSAKDNFDEIAAIGHGKSVYLNVDDLDTNMHTITSAISETILLKMSDPMMSRNEDSVELKDTKLKPQRAAQQKRKKKEQRTKRAKRESQKHEIDDEKNSGKEVDTKELAFELLSGWGLRQYADKLINSKGWANPQDWIDIDYDYLMSIGFKDGHSKRFIRKTKEYFQI